MKIQNGKLTLVVFLLISLVFSCSKSDTKSDYPATYTYKSYSQSTNEFYIRTDLDKYVKISEPSHSNKFDPFISQAIQDGILYPYKEFTLQNETTLSLIAKDGTPYNGLQYLITNNELSVAPGGFFGTFNSDKSILNGCYCYFSLSSQGNPISTTLFQENGCIDSKQITLEFLIFGNLEIGDTLAINFPNFIYERK